MIIRQKAFENAPKHMLKGGLHCHTTRSDGRVEPDACIRLHKENGYDFLALTDHRNYNFTNFAPDTDITIVPGMEMDGNLIDRTVGMCYHTVAIGPVEGNGYKQDQKFESVRINNAKEYQPVVDDLKKNGNLVIYCHPDWSCTPARSFEDLQGCFAMEIWNSGCVLEDKMDVDNGMVWDELLVRGKKIFAVATDDGHAAYQHCKGWVRVNAENNVPAILKALEEGAFYASCGPEIYDFYIEDGVAHVKCSPCAWLQFKVGVRPTPVKRNPDGLITECEVPVNEIDPFYRVVVCDENGNRAWSNPIFMK